jgi:hypothetical protein
VHLVHGVVHAGGRRPLPGHSSVKAPSGASSSLTDGFCTLTPPQARGSDLRVHFKNTREAAFAVKGMELNKAKRYLEDVLGFKRCVPFRRYNGAVGRTSQAANEGHAMGQGRWPVKSCEFVLGLLKNAESNAEVEIATPSRQADSKTEQLPAIPFTGSPHAVRHPMQSAALGSGHGTAFEAFQRLPLCVPKAHCSPATPMHELASSMQARSPAQQPHGGHGWHGM